VLLCEVLLCEKGELRGVAMAMAMVVELLRNEEELVKELCRRLRRMNASRILDVGCGTGKLALFLAVHLSCEVIGIDIDAEKVAKARERAAELGFPSESVRFYVQPAERTMFADGYFDSVVSLKALHELADASRSLSEAFRILRHGGIICIIDWVKGTQTTRSHMHAPLYFSEERLVEEMRRAGFLCVRVEKKEDLMLAEGLKK